MVQKKKKRETFVGDLDLDQWAVKLRLLLLHPTSPFSGLYDAVQAEELKDIHCWAVCSPPAKNPSVTESHTFCKENMASSWFTRIECIC